MPVVLKCPSPDQDCPVKPPKAGKCCSEELLDEDPGLESEQADSQLSNVIYVLNFAIHLFLTRSACYQIEKRGSKFRHQN